MRRSFNLKLMRSDGYALIAGVLHVVELRWKLPQGLAPYRLTASFDLILMQSAEHAACMPATRDCSQVFSPQPKKTTA